MSEANFHDPDRVLRNPIWDTGHGRLGHICQISFAVVVVFLLIALEFGLA
jgi:hypothetical protein